MERSELGRTRAGEDGSGLRIDHVPEGIDRHQRADQDAASRVHAGEPSPLFMALFIPKIFPTVAPVPAPTFPSRHDSAEADSAAR